MSVTQAVVLASAVGLLSLLAFALLRFNLKRAHIRRHAARASDEQLEAVYALVEASGSEASVGCVLARTNRVAPDDRAVVALPVGLADFPWSGRAVAVDSELPEPFRFMPGPEATTRLAGKVFRPVRVPRRRGRSGKSRNVFAPSRYLAGNEALADALRQVCPEYPGDLLAYLLVAGAETFEFEPIDQARVGGSVAWAQDAEWPKCDECGHTMASILQLPGSLLSRVPGRGTFYWFGCRQHTDRTRTVTQFT